MTYLDLGTIHANANSRKGHNRQKGFRLPKKLLVLTVIFAAIFVGVFWLRSPGGTVLGEFWSVPGAVISYVLPGSSRVKQQDDVTNVLLLGIDRRSNVPYSYQSADGTIQRNGFLADTIIVASINHRTQSVGMLSIPRDLWVEIPALGDINRQYSKINAAHALGDQFSNETDGGIKLLSQVVENILGVPIHYWARIDFEGFEKGIDAVGGVDVLVERAFDDYMFPRPGYENAPWEERWEYVHFDAGLQHMDGATTLQYARSRHAYGPEGTDFARAARQQKVIIAFKNKVTASSTLFNPSRLKELYEAVSSNLKTDISLAEIPLFYSLAKDLAPEEIKTYSLTAEGSNLLTTPADISLYGGAWVLIPTAGDFSAVQDFVQEIFYATTAP